MLNVAMVGLGRWGQTILSSVQGKSDRIRIVHGVEGRMLFQEIRNRFMSSRSEWSPRQANPSGVKSRSH